MSCRIFSRERFRRFRSPAESCELRARRWPSWLHGTLAGGLFCLGAVATAGPIAAQTAETEGTDKTSEQQVERVVRRIHELHEEIERLLSSLPAEQRAAAEAKLQSPLPSPEDEPSLPPASPAGAAKAADASSPITDPRVTPVRVCQGLDIFDSNRDGALTGADRHWRHLYLWLDDGDRQLADGEMMSVFEAGVRQIRLDLGGYTSESGGIGLVDVSDRVRFDVVIKKRRGLRSGILMLDADGLARGGGPRLFEAEEEQPLAGFQALRPGLRIGSQLFNCP